MPWTPTLNATDVRPILENLLTFIRDNNAEAFYWANGNTTLTPFVTVYNSALGRIKTDFPHLNTVSKERTTEEFNDYLEITETFTFEAEITGTDLTQLAVDVDTYLYGLESMIQNIPKATLLAGIDATERFGLDIEIPRVSYGEPSAFQSDFIWTPTMDVRIRLREVAYA